MAPRANVRFDADIVIVMTEHAVESIAEIFNLQPTGCRAFERQMDEMDGERDGSL